MVTFDDFKKVELRIGKIVDVQDHPNADRLYVLRVDLGEKEISLVAGVKKAYTPEQLMNKRVVVVANLEPKPLRGVESQGMLLAAQFQDSVSIISPDQDVLAGSPVK